MAYYIDTSALVKMLVIEQHSTELVTWVQSMNPTFAASDLLRIEALRSARRLGSRVVRATRDALRFVNFIALSSEVCELAADLEPAVLRSLDAAHVASALIIGDDLEGVLTYDERLAEGCANLGLNVVAPGVTSA
jgi:predicted nucleic acid-binding protein